MNQRAAHQLDHSARTPATTGHPRCIAWRGGVVNTLPIRDRSLVG